MLPAGVAGTVVNRVHDAISGDRPLPCGTRSVSHRVADHDRHVPGPLAPLDLLRTPKGHAGAQRPLRRRRPGEPGMPPDYIHARAHDDVERSVVYSPVANF